MSLVNRMLQDLDARHKAHEAGANHSNVRPLPAAPASRLPWLLAALAATGIMAAIYLALHEPAVPAPTLRAVPHAPPAAHPVVQTTAAVAPPLEEEGVALLPASDLAAPGEPTGDNMEKAGERESDRVAAASSRPPPVRLSEAEKTPSARASIRKTRPAAQPRGRAETAYRKALAAADRGRTAEALELLRDALNADDRHVASRQLRIKLLLAERRADEAIQTLQEGLRGQPEQTAWAMTLARLRVDRNELEEAARILRQSLPAASGNPDYLGFAGHLQQRLGHGGEAATLYRSATLLAPDDGRWWLGLGLAQESEGRNDQALAAFRRARQCANLSRGLATLVEQKLRRLE